MPSKFKIEFDGLKFWKATADLDRSEDEESEMAQSYLMIPQEKSFRSPSYISKSLHQLNKCFLCPAYLILAFLSL